MHTQSRVTSQVYHCGRATFKYGYRVSRQVMLQSHGYGQDNEGSRGASASRAKDERTESNGNACRKGTGCLKVEV